MTGSEVLAADLVDGGRVRVASYNVRAFRDDRAALVRVVRAIAPDVLCLQEVPRLAIPGWSASRFARQVGMTWQGGSGRAGQNGLLTAPGIAVRHLTRRRLPAGQAFDTRGFVVADLQLAGRQPVTVIAMHLSLRASERQAHAQKILATGARFPLIVAGDVNEDDTGGAWQQFSEQLRVISGSDATFPAAAPAQRIDAIWADPRLPVLPRSLPPLDAADLAAATDHLPVWGDVQLAAR